MSNQVATQTTKICSMCKQEKPISQFYISHRNKQATRISSYCKECSRTKAKQSYDAKQTLMNDLKTVCEKCGETKPYILQFHCPNKDDEDFTSKKFRKKSIQELHAKLKHCRCLCINCHTEFHYLECLYDITYADYIQNNYPAQQRISNKGNTNI